MRVRSLAGRGAAVAAMSFTAILAACGGGADSPVTPAVDSISVATVTVSPSAPSINVGATQAFAATARNLQGKTLSGTTFSWQSSTTATATISTLGVATGVAAGSTTITALGGGKSGTASLTVNSVAVSWVAKAGMPTARSALTTAVVNGIIYAIGGSNVHANSLNPHLAAVEAYDPTTNTWAAKAAMPGARSSLSSAVVNGVIYVFGGDDGIAPTPGANTFKPVTTVQSYDPATNAWTTRASMTIARERFAIAESNGIIYIMGGLIPDGSGFVTNTPTTHAYTVSTNTWTTRASMPTSRSFLTATALNGVIYAIGGQSTKVVEAYDIATNTWSAKASLVSISSQPVSFTFNSLAYAMDAFPFVEAYSPATNAWTDKPARTGYTSRSLASLSIVGTSMYSIGGSDSFGTLRTVEARVIP